MYKVKGADQKDYGPISAEQVRQWIAENRLNRFSLAQGGESAGWKPLGQFPEFEEALGMATPPRPPALPPGTADSMAGRGSLGQGAGTTPGSVPLPNASIGAYLSPRESALNAVNGPAMGLIICGAIGVGLALINIPTSLMGFNIRIPANMPDENSRFLVEWLSANSRWIGLSSSLLSLPWFGLMLWGGFQLRKLESQTLCTLAAVLAIIPCFSSCCCVLYAPIGIWALIAMNRPDVRDQFRN